MRKRHARLSAAATLSRMARDAAILSLEGGEVSISNPG